MVRGFVQRYTVSVLVENVSSNSNYLISDIDIAITTSMH